MSFDFVSFACPERSGGAGTGGFETRPYMASSGISGLPPLSGAAPGLGEGVECLVHLFRGVGRHGGDSQP